MNCRAYIASIMVSLMLCACSPYIYKAEIDTFHGGMNAVATAYEVGSKELAVDTEQARIDELINQRVQIRLTPGCDTPLDRAAPCAVISKKQTQIPPATEAQRTIAAAAPAFTGLRHYAAALAAITNANDDAELRAAMQGLAGSLNDLAAAVDQQRPGTAPSKAVIDAGETLFAAAATAYLDHRRFQALKTGVLAVDPVLSPLATVISDALLSIRQERLVLLSKTMRDTVAPFETAGTDAARAALDYRTIVPELRSKAETYTRIRSADQAATVTAMTVAHHRLAEAVRDESRQVRPVIDAAKDFYKAARQFQDDLTAAE